MITHAYSIYTTLVERPNQIPQTIDYVTGLQIYCNHMYLHGILYSTLNLAMVVPEENIWKLTKKYND